MRPLIFIALMALPFASWADLEIKNEITVETGVRNGTKFDVNRGSYLLSVKQGWEKVPLEFSSEIRGYWNLSHAAYGLTENDISLRTLTLSYWGSRFGGTLGLQQVNWSETFGYQPADLVNARDLRNFSLLDHGRNRLPAWAASAYGVVGPLRVTGIVSPMGQAPILPASYQGFPIKKDDSASRFLVYPEGGVRVSTTLSDSNASLFAYHHLNRFPALTLGADGALTPAFRPVESYGATFSKGFSEVVVRADAVVTPRHPVTEPLSQSIQRQPVYTAIFGADWTPEAVSSLTIGLQGQVDRLAFYASDPRMGASLLLRKTFLKDRAEVEAKAFTRFRAEDYWLQATGRLKIGDSWEWKLGAEALGTSPDSLSGLLGYRSRLWSQVSVFF